MFTHLPLLQLLFLNESALVLVQDSKHFLPVCLRQASKSHSCKEQLEVKCAWSYSTLVRQNEREETEHEREQPQETDT